MTVSVDVLGVRRAVQYDPESVDVRSEIEPCGGVGGGVARRGRAAMGERG